MKNSIPTAGCTNSAFSSTTARRATSAIAKEALSLTALSQEWPAGEKRDTGPRGTHANISAESNDAPAASLPDNSGKSPPSKSTGHSIPTLASFQTMQRSCAGA